MGLFEAFADELDKIATGAPPPIAAKGAGMLAKIKEWIKKNPGKSGLGAGWFLRGILSKDDR